MDGEVVRPMEVILKGEPKEIAALVLAVQERRTNVGFELTPELVQAMHDIVRQLQVKS